MDEVFEVIVEMSAKRAAEWFGIPYDRYANMSTEERHDWAYDAFHHNRKSLAEFMGLPEEVEIPDSIADDEDMITDWLSDEYGFCIEGYSLTTD